MTVGGFKEIPLTKGVVALVDAADFDWLSRWNWSVSSEGYARRGTRVAGKQVMFYMHRLMAGCPDGLKVDHINGDRLDNRRANLRIATSSDNAVNRVKPAGPSGYRGVRWHCGGWAMKLVRHGKHYRGYGFRSAEEAARAYDAAARIHHGEFAVLNFPEAV